MTPPGIRVKKSPPASRGAAVISSQVMRGVCGRCRSRWALLVKADGTQSVLSQRNLSVCVCLKIKEELPGTCLKTVLCIDTAARTSHASWVSLVAAVARRPPVCRRQRKAVPALRQRAITLDSIRQVAVTRLYHVGARKADVIVKSCVRHPLDVTSHQPRRCTASGLLLQRLRVTESVE